MNIKHFLAHLKSILGLGLQLGKSNFKQRNEGSYFGIFWYLLEPFLLFLIIVSLKSLFGGGGIEHYPLYLLLGLIMFNFFSGLTGRATKIITSNAKFIKSMKINPESLVISQIVEGTFSHFFEVVLFFIFMIYFKISLIWILTYIIIFGFFVLFLSGLSFILSTIGAYVNDLDNVWTVLTRLLFFLTPLFYGISEGTFIYKINLFNPMYYFLTIARDLIIYNSIPEHWMLILTAVFSVLIFIIGVAIFEKFKYKFAEVV
jgi:lipopolysaccharide transport system permease protein